MATTERVFERWFGELEDPRMDRTKKHRLIDIMAITLCAVICGANAWTEIEEFGQSKEQWLRTFLELPNGIPSHDTFARVFSLLDPNEFQSAFINWVGEVVALTDHEVIAIDGKTLRRSHDERLGKAAVHMISAWAEENRVVLGQKAVEGKANEITAIPDLLRLLEIHGCIVTIDAMGCQRDIATEIIERGADYVLAVKKNQKKLLRDVGDTFEMAQKDHYRDIQHDHHMEVSKGHGRVEIRRYWTISEPEYIDYINRDGRWLGLQSIGMAQSERRVDGKRERETRYFISSLDGVAVTFAHAVRGHWGIENRLHWVLDIAFREDESRIRQGHSAQNMTTVRHMALNMLRHETSVRKGIKTKRMKAGWSERYLMRVLHSLALDA